MNDIATLTSFIGWWTVVNFLIYSLSALMLLWCRAPVIALHSRLSGVDAEALPKLYFRFLASYKIAILMFNVAPYLALKIMTS